MLVFDVIVNKVIKKEGGKLIVDLMAREYGGTRELKEVTIENATYTPLPGQEFWGNKYICFLESNINIIGSKKRRYYRKSFATLVEIR